MIKDIATVMGRTPTTICEWVNDNRKPYGEKFHKIEEWKGKSNDDERQKAINLYSEHQNVVQVSRLMDRSYTTIKRWLDEAGVNTSRKSRPAKRAKKNDEAKNLERIQQLEDENARLRNIIQELASIGK